jgi:ABC-type uncharacterized transport system substrate-binding protein
MKRREFITLIGGGAAAWPLAARAQQAAKIARIGFLRFGSADTSASRVEALRTGLRDLGYVEGRNIIIEFRWTERIERLSALAAELVHLKVDVIFAPSSTETEAARLATSTIPIIFAIHADPVGLGHVASLPRPAGNVTGLTVVQTDLTAKAMEILKETVPHSTRLGVLWSSAAPSFRPTLQAAQTAGDRLGVEVLAVEVKTVQDFGKAFASFTGAGVGGVFVASSAFTTAQAGPLAELMLKHGLPSMFGVRDNVEAGGLMSYAPDHNDLTRRSATYIERILKGSKPADLPVEQASKYRLTINLKTAKALGIEVPPTLLARADEVIE